MCRMHCVDGIHHSLHTEMDSNRAVTTCKWCGTIVHDGPPEKLIEWIEGGPAPWSEERDGLIKVPYDA